MQQSSSTKTKRPVTACRECYRRKQKCNRLKPCNHCTARNVPQRCSYTSTSQSASDAPQRPLVSPSKPTTRRDADDDELSTDPFQLSLQYQMGYPSAPHDNAFNNLEESYMSSWRYTASNNGRSTDSLADIRAALNASIGSQLPSTQVIRELVDVYFNEANWWLRVIEPYHFDKLFDAWNSSTSVINLMQSPYCSQPELKSFPALLLQLLAVSLQFVSLDTPAAKALNLTDSKICDRLSERYSDKAEELLNSQGRRRATITAIMHDLLRATWLKNCSRGAEAWYPLGTAIRQAQDLGLHLLAQTPQSSGENVEDALARFWHDEMKRRLWVTLFIWDSHMSSALGRPRSINISDCTTKTPIDCAFPKEPSKTLPMEGGLNGTPSTYTGSLFLYALSYKIHETLTSGANKRYVKDYKIVKDLDCQVHAMMKELPPAVRLENPDTTWDIQEPVLLQEREQIASSVYVFLLQLHRPHYVTHEESRQAATQAALKLLESQQRWFERTPKHQYRLFTLSIYTFDASIFLTAVLLEWPPQDVHTVEQIHSAIRRAIVRLGACKESIPMARSGEQVLMQCYQKSLEAQVIPDGSARQPDSSSSTANESSTPAASDSGPSIASGPGASGTPVLDFQETDFLGFTLPDSSEIFADVTSIDFNPALWVQSMDQSMQENDYMTWPH